MSILSGWQAASSLEWPAPQSPPGQVESPASRSISANSSMKSPRPRRARLHEVLVGIPRVAGAHEHVHDVVHVPLRLGQRQVPRGGQRAGQGRVAAIVVVRAAQYMLGVGVASRADHVVDPGPVFVEPVPVERVVGDGGHRAQPRHAAPQAVAGADMGRVQRARLAAVEPFREVRRVPQVQIAHLRAIGDDDAEQMAGRDVEGPRVAGRNDHLVDLGHGTAYRLVEVPVVGRQLVHRVDRDGFDRAPCRRVGGLPVLRRYCHCQLLSVGCQRAMRSAEATTSPKCMSTQRSVLSCRSLSYEPTQSPATTT